MKIKMPARIASLIRPSDNRAKKKKDTVEQKQSVGIEKSLEAASNYNKSMLLAQKKVREAELNQYDDYVLRVIREENPEDFFKSYFHMFADDFKDFRAGRHWLVSPLKNGKIYPWKIHLYSDNKQDYMRLFATIFPYLKNANYNWKSYNPSNLNYVLNKQNTGAQKGKAFTIYPHSREEFKKIAQDLEYILKNNGLEISGSKIEGDRALGSTGRLFYRYEYKTGAAKDKIFDLSEKSDYALYQEVYDRNRGANNYLAPDMSIKDDPWYHFKP